MRSDSGEGDLDRRRFHLVRIAGAVAAAADQSTGEVIGEALDARIHSSEIYEVILQGYLTGGFPRTINAFAVFRSVQESRGDRWRPAPAGWDDPDAPDEWLRRGERLCREVYASVFDKLKARISLLSPDLFHWLLSEGYGKVLGRPGLPAPDRELCLMASLVVLGIDRQTRSHIRGARNLGFSARTVEEVIEAVAPFAPSGAIAAARIILRDLEGE